MRHLDRLANYLDKFARSSLDTEAAQAIRDLTKIADAAHDLVRANTEQGSKAAYAELVYLIKGKKYD